MISATSSLKVFDRPHLKLSNDEVYLAYLPLAHVFERVMFMVCLMHRIQYGLFHGDVLALRDDAAELKPTIMVGVPRLLIRIHDMMKQKISEL